MVANQFGIFMPFEHAREFLHNTLSVEITETCLNDMTHRIGTK